jgi:hypothetical protein
VSHCTVNVKVTKSPEQLLGEGELLRLELSNWLAETFGDRCPEFCPECICCEAWKWLDQMTGILEQMNP